ncbi:MAG TPA: hypothetical protein VK638_13670 [Edaphobacter sp.]|nr:hypothetical protein [Edaphobacter sp.]
MRHDSETHPDDVAETDDVPKVDTTSEKYAVGFDAGPEGKPCDGETREWRRGWADASNKFYLSRVVGW